MSSKNLSENDSRKQNKFWSDFSEKYHASLYEHAVEYPSLIIRHNYILELFDNAGKEVVDIGCGPGEMLCDLIEKGCHVTGIDIAEGMLEVARKNIRKKFPDYEPKLMCGNIEKLDLEDQQYDCVICAGVIEYLKTDDNALKELNRILKLNGTLIITTRNKACLFRIFDTLSDKIKESKTGLSILNKIRGILGKDPIKYISYRKHFPWEIDKNLKAYGFEKQGYRYFHFYPFFVPFDKIAPRTFIKLGLKMEVLARSFLGILGSGYIVKVRKAKDAS